MTFPASDVFGGMEYRAASTSLQRSYPGEIEILYIVPQMRKDFERSRLRALAYSGFCF